MVVGLITADLHYRSLGTVRSLLDSFATPFYRMAELPLDVRDWFDKHLVSRGDLLAENERLSQESVLLKARSQQMAALQAENVRLRALLNSTALLRDDVLVAELLGVSPDPQRHLLVLNKGSQDGVFVGQPLIDADGLMGQVVEVAPGTSRALLITDPTHSIPVQVVRNGVRAIAEGTGSLGALEIHHIASTTDIRVGDQLVTSGLGGRFPVGYPVAVVTEVERDPGKTYTRVLATPSAALDRSRHVLLVFAGRAQQQD